MCCANVKAKACNFTKINTPPWVFFTFFKFYKWYQIAQRIIYSPVINFFLLIDFFILFLLRKTFLRVSRTVDLKKFYLVLSIF